MRNQQFIKQGFFFITFYLITISYGQRYRG